MYKFSDLEPINSPSAMWALQQFMVLEVERRLGHRDAQKTICQPTFHDDPKAKPCIVNRFSLDGAWACLSVGSKTNWECAYFEIAHETVHLLNPVVGNTNYLEEGVAVVFAEKMQQLQGIALTNIECPFYKRAKLLVEQLPGGVFEAATKIREICGSLGVAKSSDLTSLFPTLNQSVADELCMECNFT
ncbi:hypothetical protein RH728_004173 [Vibrio vulnificus]|nr:hypothetical protein [Vibrio vulnificus]EJV2652578.1 hypothetical protein [Vibrio vulnificus]EKA6052420.1 hypothetical protein [Vibrio vulnificus]EKZ9226854.1 hypothetical protein [Vibrio vulnificus]ELB7645979.1 hypothetical protein [Vibrio vulnificus]